MVKMNVIYEGEKHCVATHGPSGSKIETDAPVDNHGRGEKFSPTDLVGAALGSCILTVIGILADRDGFSIKGAVANVEKEMNPNPRRIAKLPVVIQMPAGIPHAVRNKIENAAHTCPVHKSLHPDIDSPITIHYPD